MHKLLVDTHVFRKLNTEYKELLECISSCNGTILTCNEIDKELQGRMRFHSPMMVQGYLETLRRTCPVTPVKKNRYEKKYKNYCNKRKPPVSPDSKDQKWVKIAVSEHAQYIISSDGDLDLPEFRTNGNICRCVTPHQYMTENCSA